MIRPILRLGLLVFLGLWLLTSTLSAQYTDSNLVGTVVDSTGAAVPNATITLTNKDTGVKYTTTSNSSGEYRFNNVPVGANYQVSATAQGFSTAVVGGVALQLNHTATVNVTLAVGAVSTTIEVTASSAMIDTTSSQLQTTFNTMQAVDIPLGIGVKNADASGIYNLSLLGAGVATSGGVGQGVGPSIAGQRPENNTFMVDGVPNNSGYSTGPEEYVSNEVIAELNVAQNQFNAEFGGASGGVFNVIMKSGTNSIHGSLFEYFQNRDLNAVDYNTVVGGNRHNPRFDSNRFGATVGGPVIKNKLFYFGSYEYNPIGQASVPGNPVDAPTQAGLSLLNSMTNLSKTNLSTFEKYVPVAPSPDGTTTTVNGVKIPLGQLSFASPNFSNAYHATIAIDYNISDKDQLRGRWIYDNYAGIDNLANLPVFFGTNPNYNNAGSISEFHSFSPTLHNEFRVAYRRFFGNTTVPNITFPGLSVFPNFSFDDLGLQLGPDPDAPGGSISNTSSLQENVTKNWHRHTFKMGYQIIDTILAGTFVQRARGDYDYTNLEEYLLDLQPSGGDLSGVQGERSAGAPSGAVPFGFLQNAAFFQDDWRVSSHLTLNLGLRYEYNTVPVGSRTQALSSLADVPGVIKFRSPKSSTNDWAPRVGFAYTPDNNGRWVVRGGVGRAFDNTYINLNQNASPAYYQTTQDVDPSHPVSNFLKNGALSGIAPVFTTPAEARAAIASYTFDQDRPYALIGTIGVQHLLGNNYSIEARYTYTKGVHLWNQTRMNIVAPVNASNFLPTFYSTPTAATLAGLTTTLGQLQALPRNFLAQYGFPNNITGYHPWGNSRYNGLAVQLNKRYSNNLSYIVSYTWSHNFDDSTATNFSTILSPRRAQDFQNLRAEWSSSALDRRQRLTIAPIYDFKPFQNGNWWMKNLVGNWNISGVYTYQSPEFATVQSPYDANLNGDSLDRSITNPAGDPKIGSTVVGLTATGQQVPASSTCNAGQPCKNIVAYVATNPNARYVVAGLGARSNTGRNTLPLDHTNNFDMALSKKFTITERFRFDIGAQAANVFNHSQFTGGYLSDVGYFTTNAISRAFLTPNSGDFGRYNLYLPSNSRQVLLVAHFVF